MIEMLKNRKEALQKRGVKGFTLMEMLIVIAIIAVLVAIAIPVLGSQLDRAKAATDEANIRDGYASAQVTLLQATGTTSDVSYYGLNKDGSVVKNADGDYACQGASEKLGSDVNIGGMAPNWTANSKVYFKVENGQVKDITTTKPTAEGSGGSSS